MSKWPKFTQRNSLILNNSKKASVFSVLSIGITLYDEDFKIWKLSTPYAVALGVFSRAYHPWEQ